MVVLLVLFAGAGALLVIAFSEGSLSKASRIVDVISKVVTTLAILAGAVWALFTYVLYKIGANNLLMTLDSEAVTYRDNLRVVVIRVTLKNVGRVRVLAGSGGCTLSI